MSEADPGPSKAVREPRPGRGWVGFLHEAPYFAIVILGVVGVSTTSFFRSSTEAYWIIITPIVALLSIMLGAIRLPPGRGRLDVIVIQFGQWAAVLVAMYLIHLADVSGDITSDARGSIMLTLLALGVFNSGLDLRAWKLCVAGGFLAVAVPALVWFEQAALLVFLIGAVLLAILLFLWWTRDGRAPRRV